MQFLVILFFPYNVLFPPEISVLRKGDSKKALPDVLHPEGRLFLFTFVITAFQKKSGRQFCQGFYFLPP